MPPPNLLSWSGSLKGSRPSRFSKGSRSPKDPQSESKPSEPEREEQELRIIRPEWENSATPEEPAHPDRKYIYFLVDEPKEGTAESDPATIVRIVTDQRFREDRERIESIVRTAISGVIASYSVEGPLQCYGPHQSIYMLENCHEKAVEALKTSGLSRGQFELMPVFFMKEDETLKPYRDGIDTFRKHSSVGPSSGQNRATMGNKWMYKITGITWYHRSDEPRPVKQTDGASMPLLLTLKSARHETEERLNTHRGGSRLPDRRSVLQGETAGDGGETRGSLDRRFLLSSEAMRKCESPTPQSESE